MEGGVWWGADGGQGVLGLGDVAVRAWRATSSVGVPLSSRVACSSRVASPTRVACSSRVASSSPVASRVASLRVLPVFACCCRRTLSAGGAGRLRLLVVLDPRRRPWGGPLTIPQRPHDVRGVGARLVCYPVCAVVLGLQTRLVKGGAMTTGWPLTFPSAHITYVAWALRSFAILLAQSSWGCKRG